MPETSKKRFKELKQYVQTDIEREIKAFWESDDTFRKSISTRSGKPAYVFYEGPPSANGMPGIHHVMARTIKDIFCRFKTIQGYQVERKAGWDTHGLPIELQVEKTLGITKKDIGTKISVEDYNRECRKEVLRFKDKWDELTRMIGYWVDLDHPYVTYENEYIESLWWLLKQLYNKGLIYKGLKIQPYSPAAGTGLSSHELNQPGCYRDVKDTSCVAMFKFSTQSAKSSKQLSVVLEKENIDDNLFFLAWTTTPWTLPSNTALAVGEKIDYVLVKTFNPYTHIEVNLLVAKALMGKYFQAENENKDLSAYQKDGKNLPYQVLATFPGKDLVGLRYEQLLPFDANKKEHIEGDAFRVLSGDFVTTEDGTGIVHIAPSFGADDMKVAGENGIGALTLVDRQGKFIDGVGEFSGRYVKDYTDDPNYVSVDIDICVKLKQENRAFRIEKYEHSYPHCWRTEKPVIYYPLDSWFIKVTAMKDRLIQLNEQINWKPASTGTGRFGQWLENLVDWNLSRSRFWGTPLPIWRTEDGSEQICIGSIEELTREMLKAQEKGHNMKFEIRNSKFEIDLHKPYVDDIVLVSDSGQPMYREPDLIDVWFDSGGMPYAQWHYLAPSNSPQGGGLTPSNSPQGGDLRSAEKIKRHYETANPEIYRILKESALHMRSNPTEAENALWQQLRGKRLENYKFRRQHPIDDFIADFVCLSKHLIIEVDGGYHSSLEQKEADELRTTILEELGYKVMRFTNEEVLQHMESVLDQINRQLAYLPTLEKHYPRRPPFGGKEGGAFPADFIAEGVDQTRGWFYTLHAIAGMLFDSVAYKNVVSNGLVLDKNGNKMSKSKGNTVDPFETIRKYGADPLRWYMIANGQPWDNLKFDLDGVLETQRKLFGTLYNTYNFFAIYANVDGFAYDEKNRVPVAERPEIDRWIISKLNSLIREVTDAFDDYEPARAARAIEDFATENLSNWHVRLSRRRFWDNEPTTDKKAAFETLLECLRTVAQLMSPVAPYFSDWLYQQINGNTESVHLAFLPPADENRIDAALEQRMEYAQEISSLVLSLRKKTKIKVRQPLQKILIPAIDPEFITQVDRVKDLVLSEVNVKEIEYISDTAGIISKKVKPNFKVLGKKLGGKMKLAAEAIQQFSDSQITELERNGRIDLQLDGDRFPILLEDVEILSDDIQGWLVASDNRITVALDITISEALRQEGFAREIVNRVQNERKESGLQVTDKIRIHVQNHPVLNEVFHIYKEYICNETLAPDISLEDNITGGKEFDINGEVLFMFIQKIS